MFDTQVEDVFFMTLDDMDVEEKDRLWVSWQSWSDADVSQNWGLISFIHS